MIFFEDYAKVNYDISSAFFQTFNVPSEYHSYFNKTFKDKETIQDTETGDYIYINKVNNQWRVECASNDDYVKFLNFVKTNADVIKNENTVSGDIAPTNQGFTKRVMKVKYPFNINSEK